MAVTSCGPWNDKQHCRRYYTRAAAAGGGETSADVIQKLLDTVPPPEIGKYDKKRK
jgi:hypothetical protein